MVFKEDTTTPNISDHLQFAQGHVNKPEYYWKNAV